MGRRRRAGVVATTAGGRLQLRRVAAERHGVVHVQLQAEEQLTPCACVLWDRGRVQQAGGACVRSVGPVAVSGVQERLRPGSEFCARSCCVLARFCWAAPLT